MRKLFFAVWALSALAATCLADVPARQPIVLSNYVGGEVLRYTVPLIRGKLADANLASVEVINESSHRDTARMTCLAHKGRFKALTELVPGENRIVIRAGKDALALTLTYEPQTNPKIVRIIYATDSTGATDYQTPIPGDRQDYAAKLSTMMLMMQTFTGERLNDLGMGRRTFNLELDKTGKVKVHLLRCDKTAQQIYTMGGGRRALFAYLDRQLDKQLPQPGGRNVVIPAFSRFDPLTKHNKAYTALGGGNLACSAARTCTATPAAWPTSRRPSWTRRPSTRPIIPATRSGGTRSGPMPPRASARRCTNWGTPSACRTAATAWE